MSNDFTLFGLILLLYPFIQYVKETLNADNTDAEADPIVWMSHKPLQFIIMMNAFVFSGWFFILVGVGHFLG